MKKMIIAYIIALAATAATAIEVGLTVGNNYAKSSAPRDHEHIIGPMMWSNGTDRTEYGITLGDTFGNFRVSAGYARSNGGTPTTIPTDGPYKNQVQHRYSAVAGYDVVKIGSATITPKLGVAYLNNARDSDGYTLTVGVGASIPLTKQVSVGLDVARQYGQSRVNQFDGNRVTAGLNYRF